MKADWAHVFLSVLPPLPLAAPKDENRIALALKAACAGVMARQAHPSFALLHPVSQLFGRHVCF